MKFRLGKFFNVSNKQDFNQECVGETKISDLIQRIENDLYYEGYDRDFFVWLVGYDPMDSNSVRREYDRILGDLQIDEHYNYSNRRSDILSSLKGLQTRCRHGHSLEIDSCIAGIKTVKCEDCGYVFSC